MITIQQNELEIVKIYKNRQFTNKENIVIGNMRLLEDEHLPSVINLQEKVVSSLKDRGIFHPNSIDFLQFCVKKYGRMIGIFVKHELIAYCVIYFPGNSQDNLGADLSFSKTMLHKVAHLEMIAVHPDYRGNSLALKMSQQALVIMKMLKYQHACVTVSPDNFYSLNVVFKSGFLIKALNIKYGDKLRYILHKNLLQEQDFHLKNTVGMPNTNTETQKQLLAQGFIGYKLYQTVEGYVVMFGKEMKECKL